MLSKITTLSRITIARWPDQNYDLVIDIMQTSIKDGSVLFFVMIVCREKSYYKIQAHEGQKEDVDKVL